MSLSIAPISCQKPQLQSHKKPNFTARIDSMDPLLEYVATKGEKGANFVTKLDRLGKKIANMLYRDEEGFSVSVEQGKKANKFNVIATKDESGAYGAVNFKYKNLFSGEHNCKRFFKAIKNAKNAIDFHPTQIKEDGNDVIESINKCADENAKEIKSFPKEEADEIEN